LGDIGPSEDLSDGQGVQDIRFAQIIHSESELALFFETALLYGIHSNDHFVKVYEPIAVRVEKEEEVISERVTFNVEDSCHEFPEGVYRETSPELGIAHIEVLQILYLIL
jgi:hypothetical protein